MSKCVIYVRFSPRPTTCWVAALDSNGKKMVQVKEGSAEYQIEMCKIWIKKSGHEVRLLAGGDEAIFADRYISGAAKDRDGLRGALAALKKGDLLVVHKLDRLTRGGLVHSIMYEEHIKSKGASLISVSGEGTSTNKDDPTSKLIRTIFYAMADFQKVIGAERTRTACRSYQRNGKRMTHKDKLPFGRMLDPDDEDRTLHCEEELKSIARIIDLFGRSVVLKGNKNRRKWLSYDKIVLRVNQEGFRRRKGISFTKDSVVRILKADYYPDEMQKLLDKIWLAREIVPNGKRIRLEEKPPID